MTSHPESASSAVLLDADAERDLAARLADGCPEALDRLVRANLGFVVRVAREYRGLGVPVEDLVSEGNLGLLQAARRFDAGRGVRFITFAVFWIRKAMRTAIAEQGPLVRVPDSRLRKLRRLRETAGDGDFPRVVRLDAPCGREGRGTIGELLADPDATSVESDLIRREQTARVACALEALALSERRVLEQRFGLDGGPPLVLREVGSRLGISRERVRQIEVRATERLRRILVRSAPPARRSSQYSSNSATIGR